MECAGLKYSKRTLSHIGIIFMIYFQENCIVKLGVCLNWNSWK